MTRLKLSWRTAAMSLLFASAPLLSFGATQTSKPQGLIATVKGETKLVVPMNAIDGSSRAVKIDRERLLSSRFFVELPDGISFEAVRDTRQELSSGRFAWVGHTNSSSLDKVVIAVSGDAMAATFSVNGRLFKLEPRANGGHVVSEVHTSDPAPELDPVPVADAAGSAAATSPMSIAANDAPIIDVLVAYTPQTAALYGTEGAEALIILAVAETNLAYQNSGITARLNLVQTVATDYVESGDMNTDLNRLHATSDGYMDELHALRDLYGADLVSLIEEEPSYCGFAYRMASLSVGFAANAFSVVNSSCATGYYTFAHELAHNQGAHHDPANASGAMYPYAYGYQDPFNSFRTVMAYDCDSGCTRVDHFSSPFHFYDDQATGIADYADNALTLNNTATTIARFREGVSQTSPPDAPENLNAVANGTTVIGLSWTDNSADESGFTLERSTDGVTFAEIASLPANSSIYLDNGLAPATLYIYRARAWGSAGSSEYSNVASAATEEAETVYTELLATEERSSVGVQTGSYEDTWVKDGVYETITEELRENRLGKSRAALAHRWTFVLAPGDSAVFIADAHTDASNDSFTFAYSTDKDSWVSMFTIDDNTSGELQFTLPAGISDTVFIQVKDNVRAGSGFNNNSVKIDQLLIRSENTPATVVPPSLTVTSN